MTSEDYKRQAELNKKYIEEIANEIQATAEKLYRDLNSSPTQNKNNPNSYHQSSLFAESATWQQPALSSSIPSYSPTKYNDPYVTPRVQDPSTKLSESSSNWKEYCSVPVSSNIREPADYSINQSAQQSLEGKYTSLIAKADLILARSPKKTNNFITGTFGQQEVKAVIETSYKSPYKSIDDYPLVKSNITTTAPNYSNLRTLPKSPVAASSFGDTYNSLSKPGHTRNFTVYDQSRLIESSSRNASSQDKSGYHSEPRARSVPRDFPKEYVTSTKAVVSPQPKAYPTYTETLGTYEYGAQKQFDPYKALEPKKEEKYDFGPNYSFENKNFDQAKLDRVLSGIAVRKGLSPDALKTPPRPDYKDSTNIHKIDYNAELKKMPEYVDRPYDTIKESTLTANFYEHRASDLQSSYQSNPLQSKYNRLDYGIDTLGLNNQRTPPDVTLSKPKERPVVDTGHYSTLMRDDYSSVRADSAIQTDIRGYDQPRSAQRSMLESIEALENDLDSLYNDIQSGKLREMPQPEPAKPKYTFPQGREIRLDSQGREIKLDAESNRTGIPQGQENRLEPERYQGLYKGRDNEYGNEIVSRHKDPYGANEGLVYVKELDKRRLHQGESFQGGSNLPNKDKAVRVQDRAKDEELWAPSSRNEENAWKDEERYKFETGQKERDYYERNIYEGRREEQGTKQPDRREPVIYESEYNSPPASNIKSPNQGLGSGGKQRPKYSNKTEQVTPTRSDVRRQGSSQKGTNKIEKVFRF